MRAHWINITLTPAAPTLSQERAHKPFLWGTRDKSGQVEPLAVDEGSLFPMIVPVSRPRTGFDRQVSNYCNEMQIVTQKSSR